MLALSIGDFYTTAKSGVRGIVEEIVPNDNGTFRVCLDTPLGERWTTVW
jgi:hypothetical protein